MQTLSFIPENFLILVVDDIAQNLKVVGSMLNDIGYNTTFAVSGQQALERLKNITPDLILLDMMMPDMDGLQVCQAIKEDQNYQEIPIIFLTASHEQEHLVNAFDLGAVDYVTKPFRKPELLARVKTHLTLKYITDELKKKLAEVEKLAQIDALTGVLNRRSFLKAAEQEFNQACRYESTFSLLLLDIDHFKKINDTYGHLTGDRALVTFTSVVSSTLRKVDLIGRYGGEEFVVLMPHTNASQALTAAHRIRSVVAETPIPTLTNTLSITVSIGIAVYQTEDIKIDDMFHRADDALYQAKAKGRNTCCI
ncbi:MULTISPECIES: diguanylate cyclase [unclassified Anabaena]|uniref:diguanylate cyclase n=1 Tax=unclassified Anabaena TaxID=2619674 RepID=UPI000830F15F|nr:MULTISPECIES: diguanylate cyclase [unclassified Anabaena]